YDVAVVPLPTFPSPHPRLSIRLTFVAFFFSSRRRHTRFSRDWSSDVCSSDLPSRAARHATRSKLPLITSAQLLRSIAPGAKTSKIGRASCRERVENWVVDGALKKKNRLQTGGTTTHARTQLQTDSKNEDEPKI